MQPFQLKIKKTFIRHFEKYLHNNNNNNNKYIFVKRKKHKQYLDALNATEKEYTK